MSLNCPSCGEELSLRLAALSLNSEAIPSGIEPQAAVIVPQPETVEPQSSPVVPHPPVEGVRASRRLKYQYQDPYFQEFWKVYPRRVGKASAFSRWKAVTREVEPQIVIAAAFRYAEWAQRTGVEPQFIKYPEGWLSAGRWEDELVVPAGVGESDPAHVVGTPEYEARVRADEERIRREWTA